MPINLFYIVLFQAVIWAIVRILPNSSQLDKKQWATVAATGLLFGVSMDLALGAFGIFAYLPDGPQASVIEPHNLEIYLLLFNAFISYGIAVATLAMVADSMTVESECSTFWMTAMRIAIFAGILGVIFSPTASFAILFSWGLVIVSSGELLLMLINHAGPLVSMLSQMSYVPFFKLWTFSIMIGASYEIANLFFPFWVWLPNSGISTNLLRLLIILLGYFALFHAITTLWVLFGGKIKNNEMESSHNKSRAW